MRLFLVFILFSSLFCRAQVEFISKEEFPLIFYNFHRDKYTIIDDSLGCYEFNLKINKWEFRKLHFNLNESFKDFLKGYEVLHEKNSKIFFVDKGCGQVYVLKNDTIKRDDRSSHHKNQYGGTFFLYKREPHIFGGYGLFSYKNLITRYDIIDKEWYGYEIKGTQPKPMYMAFGKVENDNFYLLSGNLQSKTKKLKEVWRFNFKTKKWYYFGKFNDLINNRTFEIYPFSYHDYLMGENFILQILFSKRKYVKYVLNIHNKVQNIIPHLSYLLIHKINSNTRKSEIIITKKASFLNKIVFKKDLIKTSKSDNTFVFIIICSGLIFIVLIFRFNSHKKRKGSLFIESELDSREKELLAFFIKNIDHGIEISQINDFVNGDQPSIDTLKKRREILLKDFKTKISNETNIDFNEIFKELKHPEDRRIKLLIINPKVHLFYKNINERK